MELLKKNGLDMRVLVIADSIYGKASGGRVVRFMNGIICNNGDLVKL